MRFQKSQNLPAGRQGQKDKIKKIDKAAMREDVARSLDQNQFNLYRLVEQYKFL